MIKFNCPSVNAFQYRKTFHSCQRTHSESTNKWFHRIQYLITACEYGIFKEMMLIDKFLSGLNHGDFVELSQLSIWSEEQLFQFVNRNQLWNQNSFKNEDYSSAIDVAEMLDVQTKEEYPNVSIR